MSKDKFGRRGWKKKGKRKEGRRKSFKVTVGKGNGKPD